LAAHAERLIARTTDERWHQIAMLPSHAVILGEAAHGIIARENPDARRAGALAITKAKVEDPLLRMIMNLQASVALDGVRNEYTLHRAVHEWFAAGDVRGGVDELNGRVYAQLFLMPPDDPWLGLSTPDRYTGLENGGVAAKSPRSAGVGR
jgi:hypothetical protein